MPLRRGRPGSRLLLFASPKRSNQEKGDRRRCPSGSRDVGAAGGKRANSLRSDMRVSDPPTTPTSRQRPERNSTARSRPNPRSKSTSRSNPRSKPERLVLPRRLCQHANLPRQKYLKDKRLNSFIVKLQGFVFVFEFRLGLLPNSMRWKGTRNTHV